MNQRSSLDDQEKRTWLEIYDPEIEEEQLAVQIAERVRQRRLELGEVRQHYPAFGSVADLPEPISSTEYSPNLYLHLRRLNRLDPPETTLMLKSSPATRLPVIGRLWQSIRREAHNLVRFYVNRAISHNLTVNNHSVSVLNELTRLAEAQHNEIEQLRTELAALKRQTGEEV